MPIGTEGAGENVFLIQENVQEQFSQKRFWSLRVPGIKDAVTAIQARRWLAFWLITSRVRFEGFGSGAKCLTGGQWRRGQVILCACRSRESPRNHKYLQ